MSGPVEQATRAFVAELGPLDGRRLVAAEMAVRLAILLDDEESGSAAAAIARDLRLVMATLDARVETHPVVPVAEVRVDPVAAARDDLARKRRQRAGGS